MWILPNGEANAYDAKTYVGRDGLAQLESGLGMQFPSRIHGATYPEDSAAALSALIGETEQAKCGIKKSDWPASKEAGRTTPTPMQLAAWGPWNVLHPAEAVSFPCPSMDNDAFKSHPFPFKEEIVM